jgi:hypothetical protein
MPENLPQNGLVAVVKRSCPTCVLAAPVLGHLAQQGGLKVYTQDDPSFPDTVPGPIDDIALDVSHRLGIEIVPQPKLSPTEPTAGDPRRDHEAEEAGQSGRGRILKAGEMVVFVAGEPPIAGTQILYFLDPTFGSRVAIRLHPPARHRVPPWCSRPDDLPTKPASAAAPVSRRAGRLGRRRSAVARDCAG